MGPETLSEKICEDMERKGIDIGLTLEMLRLCNDGLSERAGPASVKGVPAIDGSAVIDARNHDRDRILLSIDPDLAERNLSGLGITPGTGADFGRLKSGFSARELENIGRSLLPLTAYGVLNGGSATSYADPVRNRSLGEAVSEVLAADFARLAPDCLDKPKGITPAFINPDGSPGPSFLELKMRARLLMAAGNGRPFMPLFQMASSGNASQLEDAYREMAESPLLAPLARRTGIEAASWSTGIQPMIAAFTHSREGAPRRVFGKAGGMPDSTLPLPGGHGQCFRVLAPIFREYLAKGIRYVCIGNVDNIGYVPDPLELGILAVSGKPAAFDFAARTPMDIKGGILVETEDGRRRVADIGQAIAFDKLLALEESGFTILFNCASGIFDLSWLVPRLVEISAALPVRISDQDKAAGSYAQAEQNTWEVTGFLDSFIAFVVDKKERFLAAKLLSDTLLTSGRGLGDPRLPEALRLTATEMNEGLGNILRKIYGMKLSGGRWIPDDKPGGR